MKKLKQRIPKPLYGSSPAPQRQSAQRFFDADKLINGGQSLKLEKAMYALKTAVWSLVEKSFLPLNRSSFCFQFSGSHFIASAPFIHRFAVASRRSRCAIFKVSVISPLSIEFARRAHLF